MKKSTFCCLLSFLFCLSAFSQALDTSFSGDGKATFSTPSLTNSFSQMALQPDGKIVVLGYSNSIQDDTQFLFVRFLPNGNLDTAFGTNGSVLANSGLKSYGNTIKIQPDGKILAAGSTKLTPGNSGESDMMIVRLNADGSFDNTFGTSGIKVINRPFSEDIEDIAIQADGKIILSGATAVEVSYYDSSLVRLNANGSIDTTFGTDGYATINFYETGSDYYRTVSLAPDGKIVATGATQTKMTVVRFLANGMPDTSFGINGAVQTAIGIIADTKESLVFADKSILVAGGSFNGAKYNATLVKYLENGTLDPSFGVNGIVLKDFGSGISSFANSIKLDLGGKIKVGYTVGPSTSYDFGVGSYNLNGSADASFGTNGFFPLAFTDEHDQLRTLLIQPDNKILVGGSIVTSIFGLARITNTSLATDNFVSGSHFVFAPNPIGSNAELLFHLDRSRELSFRLYDSKGMLVSHLVENQNFKSGENQIAMDLPELAKGIYFLGIFEDVHALQTIKIVK